MKRPAIILICLLLQACSATTKGLGNSLWESLFGTPGVHLTDDELQNMPYASQYMQLNDGPQLFVVLAFDENGQQKWVTQDQATIVTQHGRIVKTLLGGDNLLEVNNLADDPLIKPNQIADGAAGRARWLDRTQAGALCHGTLDLPLGRHRQREGRQRRNAGSRAG